MKLVVYILLLTVGLTPKDVKTTAMDTLNLPFGLVD